MTEPAGEFELIARLAAVADPAAAMDAPILLAVVVFPTPPF